MSRYFTATSTLSRCPKNCLPRKIAIVAFFSANRH